MVFAISEGFGQGGHAKSLRPWVYVRLEHIQPDASEPIERYALDAAEANHLPGSPVPTATNPWTGAVEAPRQDYLLVPASAANPFTEEEYVFENGNHRQHIWFSKRHGMVTRWRTVLAAPYNLDLEWLAGVGPPGLGQALGGADRWNEWSISAYESRHNPTHGGARILPFSDFPVLADAVKVPPPVVLTTEVTPTRTMGAVLPLNWMDLQGDAAENRDDDSPHNTDPSHVALYWQHKSVEIVEPFLGGSPFLHLVHHYHYQPVTWQSSDFELLRNDPLLGLVPILHGGYKNSHNIENVCYIQHLIGFDGGWYADMVRDRELRDFELLSTEAVWDVPTYQRWNITKTRSTYSLHFQTKYTGASLFPSGYGVLAQTRSSDDFTVAMGFRLEDTPVSGDGQLLDDTYNGWTSVNIQNGDPVAKVADVPHPSHVHPGVKAFILGAGSVNGRAAGWCGGYQLLYVGPRSELMSTMRDAQSYIKYRPDMRAEIPKSVRSGTDLADELVQRPHPSSPFPSTMKRGANLK